MAGTCKFAFLLINNAKFQFFDHIAAQINAENCHRTQWQRDSDENIGEELFNRTKWLFITLECKIITGVSSGTFEVFEGTFEGTFELLKV